MFDSVERSQVYPFTVSILKGFINFARYKILLETLQVLLDFSYFVEDIMNTKVNKIYHKYFPHNGHNLVKFAINKTIISFTLSVIQICRNPFNLSWALGRSSAEIRTFPTPLKILTSTQNIVRMDCISQKWRPQKLLHHVWISCRAFRLIVRFSFVYASSNCDWLKGAL